MSLTASVRDEVATRRCKENTKKKLSGWKLVADTPALTPILGHGHNLAKLRFAAEKQNGTGIKIRPGQGEETRTEDGGRGQGQEQTDRSKILLWPEKVGEDVRKKGDQKTGWEGAKGGRRLRRQNSHCQIEDPSNQKKASQD